MNVQEKFQATRTELSASLIEREQEVDLVLTALAAQEHVLLVGPPGTAKSLLADSLVGWISGGEKFSVLMTKFTTPEEVFGPVSVNGLKADQYRRLVDGYLPTAHVANVDEVFKGSSAILNTLLKVLNERKYRNGDTVLDCPLQLCVGASNEWPGDGEGGKELGALFDRFLFRKLVRPIGTEKSLARLLWVRDLVPKLSTTITPGEIDLAAAEALMLPWGNEAKEALVSIHREAKKEGIVPGDRRLRKAVKAAQAFAWLNGAAQVEPDHLEVLGHVLWDDPAEQPKKVAEIVGAIANPSGMQVNGHLMEAEQLIAGVDLKDLSAASVVAKKLSEIHSKLKSVGGPRAERAMEFVKDETRRIKLATIEAL
jgi:MoxR-like ATPase